MAISREVQKRYQNKRSIERHQQQQDAARPKKMEQRDDELAALFAKTDAALQASTVGNTREQLAEEMQAEMAEYDEAEMDEARRLAQHQLDAFLLDYRAHFRNKKTVADNIQELIKAAHASAYRENPAIWQRIARIEEQYAAMDTAMEIRATQDPIAFKAYHLMRMRQYKRDFEQSGIIQTPSILAQERRILSDARTKLEGRNGVVALLGPTGSGKTVTARKLAAELSSNGEYEFISAHAKMLPDDLIERQGIIVRTIAPEDVPTEIAAAQQRWEAAYPNAEDSDKEEAFAQIQRVVEANVASKAMETTTILEAVGRAAQKGTKVIIDEFNYLPPTTIAALNDILAGNAAEGFGVILTGNVGKQFLDRQGLDPAFVNRILNGVFEYDYPPQDVNRDFDKHAITVSEYITNGEVQADAIINRDLYQIALTLLEDKKGNILAPESALKDAWQLSQAFSFIQQIAARKDIYDIGVDTEGVQGVTGMDFKTINLSFRNFNQVLREWKLSGYTKPLEWFVFENIIRPAAIIAPKEAAQLYFIFNKFYGMFEGNEQWGAINVNAQDWAISGVSSITEMAADTSVQLHPFSTDEVVTAFAGIKPPEFTEAKKLPEQQEKEALEDLEERLAALEKPVQEQKRLFEAEVDIEALCSGVEIAAAPA